MVNGDSKSKAIAEPTAQDWERRYNRLCVGLCLSLGLLALVALAMCSGCDPDDEHAQAGGVRIRGGSVPTGTVRLVTGGASGPKKLYEDDRK